MTQAVEQALQAQARGEKNMKQITQFAARLLFIFVATLSFASCDDGKSGPAFDTKTQTFKRDVSLGILTYNYTDKYIYHYDVVSEAGFESGGTNMDARSGGPGAVVCCKPFYRGSKLPLELKVKYTDEYVEVPKISNFGEKYMAIDRIWKEKPAPVKGPFPANPEYVEVVFQADGQIALYLVEAGSKYGSHSGATTK
jgi:hypothetical protein